MGGKQKSTSTTVTDMKSGPAKWMQDEGKRIYDTAVSQIPETFQRYTGDRTADMGAEWDQMKGVIQGLAGPATDLDNTGSILKTLWDTDSATAGKSTQDLMNPYTDAVLDPTLRKIQQARASQILDDNAAATMSGAFGDPQAGLVRAETHAKYNEAVGDASNRAYSDAWQNAQGMKDTALNRLMGTAQGYAGLDSAKFNRGTKLAQYLSDISTREAIMKQQDLNIDYENWAQENGGYATNRAATLMSLLNHTPHETYQKGKQTTTTEQKDNSGWQALGQIGGTLLGGLIGGPAGASFGASLGGALMGGGGGAGKSLFGKQGNQAGSTGSGQFEWMTPGYF